MFVEILGSSPALVKGGACLREDVLTWSDIFFMKNRSIVLLHEESDDDYDDGRVIAVLAPRRIARGVGRATRCSSFGWGGLNVPRFLLSAVCSRLIAGPQPLSADAA